MLVSLIIFALTFWPEPPPETLVLGVVSNPDGEWVMTNWVDAAGVQRVRDMTTGEVRVINLNARGLVAPSGLDISP